MIPFFGPFIGAIPWYNLRTVKEGGQTVEQNYTCTSVKEFDAMLECINPYICVDITHIYNIGMYHFYEYPLVLFTRQHVFRFYFSDGDLSLTIYSKDAFMKMTDNGIARYSDNPGDFDYLQPETYTPTGKIRNLLPIMQEGNASVLGGFDLLFADGNRICVRSSDLVCGAMDSWVER